MLSRAIGAALAIYGRRRMTRIMREDAVVSQRRILARLVRKAKMTRFGRDHGFPAIRSIEDYQARVPLRCYEDFWRDYWQPHFPRVDNITWPGRYPYFAMSSGTTSGLNKYIPTSRALIASNAASVRDMFAHHLRHADADPELGVFRGKVFLLGGSTAFTEEAPGVLAGDMSGIEAAEIPSLVRRFFFPPLELALIGDWEVKIEKLARASLSEDIRAIIGPPNWLLVLFDRLMQLRPGSSVLTDFYPNLELVLHGGMSFAPYRERFRQLLAGSKAETREIYAASEGFFAVADQGDGEGMRLITDNGIFYEFIPVSELGSERPSRHWLGTIEPGVDYALVLTSCSGLWSYVIGDTVRFVDTRPPRLLVTGRTSYVLTAFGEHLIAEQIESAIGSAAAAIGANVRDYAVGSIFPQGSEVAGRHRYFVEFEAGLPPSSDMAVFRHALDDRLIRLNEDYQRRRVGSIGLREPIVEAVEPGMFKAWMKSRGKLGGQNKVPRIINDPALFQALAEFLHLPRRTACSSAAGSSPMAADRSSMRIDRRQELGYEIGAGFRRATGGDGSRKADQ